MAHGRELPAALELQAGGSPSSAPRPRPPAAPWHLELGRIEPHQLAIEHAGAEPALCFDPPLGATALVPTRIVIVQPGGQLELRPWPTPARSLMLPRPRAPLDDLWLLLYTAARRYWIEVPYGLCGSSSEPGDAPQLGPPRSPPDAAGDDVVLPWQTIRFKLGLVSGWQLAVVARHGRTGEIEVVAQRAEPGVPPPVALTASIGARPIAIEHHERWTAEPAPLHVARYRFLPPAFGARTYVRLAARCASATFELQLPTSLTDRSHRSAARREVAR